MAVTNARQRKLNRWFGVIALAIIPCYVVLLLYVQVSERVMRHRAERLLATMRELHVGKSAGSDLLRVRTQWGAWGDYEGTCTEEHCDYSVSLTDVAGGPRFAILVFYLGHGHLADATLRVSVVQGIVKNASFRLSVAVPKGYGTRWEREQPQSAGYVPYSSGEYTLIAEARSQLELAPSCCSWPDPVPHPNYVLTKSSGCEGCLAIWTRFLPQASSAEMLRLTAFNFDCITRWKPCADEEDIMPEAGAEYAQQLRARMIQNNRQDQCAYSVTELSKSALNAAVVRVESIPKERADGSEYPKLRLIKRLGGHAVWRHNETVNVDVSMDGRSGSVISEAFRQQKPLIVLYPSGPDKDVLEPYTCGLLPYSEQAERDVTVGVSFGIGLPQYE